MLPFALVLLAGLIIVVALAGNQAALAKQLETDVPGYLKWAAAIGIISAIGFWKPAQVPSRWLLGLVVLVIFIVNYQTVLSSLTGLTTAPAPATPPQSPTAASLSQLAANAGLSVSQLQALLPANTSASANPTLVADEIAGGGFGSENQVAAGANAISPGGNVPGFLAY